MLPSFESLREQLLRAGISPGRAQRYVAELHDHLDDLIEQQRRFGLESREARDRALVLLGSEADLARAMIQRVPERALAVRAPWAVFVMSPCLVMVAALFGIAVLMMNLLWPLRGLTPAEMPASYRELIAVIGVVDNYLIGAALTAACITLALRQRLASGWVWVGIGLIAMFNGALGFHVHLFPPDGTHKATVAYSMVNAVYIHGRVSNAATLGVAVLRIGVQLVIAGTVYKVLRKRLARACAPQ